MSALTRLVLFDIDGTLMGTAGAGRRALKSALEAQFGPMPHLEHWPFGGKTDPQIYRELLAHGDQWTAEGQARMSSVMDAYLEGLESELAASSDCHLKPGVPALLAALAAREEVCIGLLTGNLERGAVIKTARFGLAHYFRLGAYGSDSADRRELPPIAVDRARAETGQTFEGKQIVIIGDTEHDITCGAKLGVRSIAVATGQYSQDELRPHRPDHLFADLGDTAAVVEAILN